MIHTYFILVTMVVILTVIVMMMAIGILVMESARICVMLFLIQPMLILHYLQVQIPQYIQTLSSLHVDI